MSLHQGHPESAHGRSAPDACSVLADVAEAPAYGTASVAGCWVALEQSGPWGRDAALQSHLEEAVGGALTERSAGAGGRFILIRRPGGHADDHRLHGHRAYLAWAGPGPWLLAATVAEPAELLERIDWAALARGDRDALTDRWPELEPAAPVLLVCTNARRDVCCAVRGRPVALAAAHERPGRVWECSHTGGHRFAPTGVLLPHGQTLARLDVGLARDVVDAGAGGELPVRALGPAHDRGRSALAPPAQAAESWLRAAIGETSLTALSATCEPVAGRPGAWRAEVAHRDGRRWRVLVRQEQGPLERPASCGKAATPVARWDLTPDGPAGPSPA